MISLFREERITLFQSNLVRPILSQNVDCIESGMNHFLRLCWLFTTVIIMQLLLFVQMMIVHLSSLILLQR